MKWFECRRTDDLQNIGTFNTVKKEINNDLEGNIQLSAKSWNQLLNKISFLTSFFSIGKEDFDGFVSEEKKYIFCLTRLDGKNRQKNLNVNGLHYKNKELAKQWRKKIAQKIHPDKCSDPDAAEAMIILEKMFREMNK